MEWLMLHKFFECQEGCCLGALLHLTWHKRSSLSLLFILFSFVYIRCFVLFLLTSFYLASCHLPFFLSLNFFLYIYFPFWLCFMFLFTLNEGIVRFSCGGGENLKKFRKKLKKNLKKTENKS